MAPYIPGDIFVTHKAAQKAHRLFLESLTPSELEQWGEYGALVVQGSDGQPWIIAQWAPGVPDSINVIEGKDVSFLAALKNIGFNRRARNGPLHNRWCAYPIMNAQEDAIHYGHHYLPPGDVILAQKLLITTDAPTFRRTAYMQWVGGRAFSWYQAENQPYPQVLCDDPAVLTREWPLFI